MFWRGIHWYIDVYKRQVIGCGAQSFEVEVGELDDAVSGEIFRQIGKRDCPVIIYGVLSGIECAVDHGPDDI